MINIAINLPETALKYHDVLMDKLESIENKAYKKFLFEKTLIYYFYVQESPFKNYNLQFADKLFDENNINNIMDEPNDENNKESKDSKNNSITTDEKNELQNKYHTRVKMKAIYLIYNGYLKYLSDKNTELFSFNLTNAIDNLKLIGDTYTLSISLLGLSLMKIITKDTKKSKLIAGDLFKLLKMNKNLEEVYTKIINEQYQKFETVNIIYTRLLEFENKLSKFNKQSETQIKDSKDNLK